MSDLDDFLRWHARKHAHHSYHHLALDVVAAVVILASCLVLLVATYGRW